MARPDFSWEDATAAGEAGWLANGTESVGDAAQDAGGQRGQDASRMTDVPNGSERLYRMSTPGVGVRRIVSVIVPMGETNEEAPRKPCRYKRLRGASGS